MEKTFERKSAVIKRTSEKEFEDISNRQLSLSLIHILAILSDA